MLYDLEVLEVQHLTTSSAKLTLVLYIQISGSNVRNNF